MCLTWREFQTNKLCQHSVCSLKCLFLCMSIHFYVAPRLFSAATWLISYVLHLITAFSLSFIYILSLRPSLCAPSLPPFPPPLHSSWAWVWAGRQQAGRLPGWGPRWCSGESASSGSQSLQGGSTALLWPIWPRPVLAPVCDYGPAGGQQSWHLKPCQYTADWGTMWRDGLTHRDVTWLQFYQWPLDGGERMKQRTVSPGWCLDLSLSWTHTSGY